MVPSALSAPPGPLERAVLDLLERRGPSDLAAVHAALDAERVIASTTVLAAADLLLQRGLVARDADGRLAAAPSEPSATEPVGGGRIVPTSGLRPTALVPMCEPWPPRPAGCC